MNFFWKDLQDPSSDSGTVVGYAPNIFESTQQLTSLKFDVYQTQYCNKTHLTRYVRGMNFETKSLYISSVVSTFY